MKTRGVQAGHAVYLYSRVAIRRVLQMTARLGAAATRVTDRDWRSLNVTSVNVTVASVDNNDNDD